MPASYVLVIILVAIIALTIIILASMFLEKGRDPKGKKVKDGKDSPENLHDLSRRCQKLAARIQALETIIIENERNSKSTTNDRF
ncbi:MAG: hypothetical protein AAF212_05295 [Verrucomicrobiota bacterium]